MILLAVCVLILGILSMGFVITRMSLARYSSMSWRALMESLQDVDVDGIDALSREYLRPQETVQTLSESEKLRLIGGTSGLARMRHNVDVMMAMASQAEALDPESAAEAGELMRRDANKIKSAIVGQGLGRTIGYGRRRVGSYLAEACAAYILICQRLVGIYERVHSIRAEYLRQATDSRGRRVVEFKASPRGTVDSERERLV
ncbi:hypothetical protein [Acidisarcina polymorpha]|uniref:hypothetical protein n=1 Tax=Acidisarcina polymorpha TaxID=2211140 RepID=UPI001237E6C2|nr:hypothetical protein [Acidisarcina polymorpha]